MHSNVETIDVQAAPDHLTSVANAGVKTALAELLWNSVDADAVIPPQKERV